MSNDKPILHVLGALDSRAGGPVRAVLELCARGLETGHRSEVLGFGPLRVEDNPFPTELMHTLPVSGLDSYRFSPMLGSWLENNSDRYRALVLHGMWQYPAWRCARFCRSVGVPYACVPHGMLDLWPVQGQGILKRIKKSLYWHLMERSVIEGARVVFFTTAREKERGLRTCSFGTRK